MRTDIVVLASLAALTVLYAIDWYSASIHVFNTIMVLPLTLLMLSACGLQLVMTIRSGEAVTNAEPVHSQLPIMGLFTAYVLSLNFLGFDVGTFLFIAASLWLHGERRLVWLIGYAFVFASFTAIFFANMLPYEMPLLILGAMP